MFELSQLFEASTAHRSIYILVLVVAPLLLVYFVVFMFLLYRLCCNDCKKKKTKSRRVQTDQYEGDYITDTCETFLGQSENDINNGHKQQTSLLRSPAQSALCDVIRRENLKTLKSSLRKTQSDNVNLSQTDEVNNTVQQPKIRSSSEPAVASVHNFTLKETNTPNSPIPTTECYGAGESPVNSPCELPETGNCKSETSTTNVDKPCKEHTEEESSTSRPFVEIDLGNI
ncbi:uncharacterized protein [Palaemon carinicauda]|uniref:uncharacterized protein n=1 Tax=Palaemon carinicauda TaxID=392227 RepID=UPI0035B58880